MKGNIHIQVSLGLPRFAEPEFIHSLSIAKGIKEFYG
jgi:hypothetical protein